MSGGLYKNIKISQKAADCLTFILIGVLIAVIIVVICNNGFIVEFDTLGGTDVNSKKVLYGEVLGAVPSPKRQGYCFLGWYKDKAFTMPFDTESDKVTESLRLYAKWE